MDEHLYVIENIDATIIAQRPKMLPHIEMMRKNIAEALKIEVDQVNVKATTEEGLGFTGNGDGISLRQSVRLKRLQILPAIKVADSEEKKLRRLQRVCKKQW